MSCGVGRRHSLDAALLWLWYRLAAAALIRPLAWELPCAKGAALKKTKKKKTKLPGGTEIQTVIRFLIPTLCAKRYWWDLSFSSKDIVSLRFYIQPNCPPRAKAAEGLGPTWKHSGRVSPGANPEPGPLGPQSHQQECQRATGTLHTDPSLTPLSAGPQALRGRDSRTAHHGARTRCLPMLDRY